MGLHSAKLPHKNAAAEMKTVPIATPHKVVICMSQHGGVPCKPLVSVGDEVKTGQMIGNSDAVISAPVHSSITGTVTEITEILHISGQTRQAVVIEASHRQQLAEDVKPPVINSREDFISAVRNSGSVGLGGAGFPTYVKLNFDPEKTKIDTLVINGAECEPYITSDYRAFVENGENIIGGIKLIMKHLNIPRTIIGIEADKAEAIRVMNILAKKETGISVKKLPCAYPQGAEKVLVYNTTRRVIREGQLPSAAGCIVMNCSTAAFIYDYIKTGVPLINRRLTVDGDIVNKPMNLMVPIGTPVSEIYKIANLQKNPDRVILGGPMMGNCIYDLDTPIMKTNNAVLFFANSDRHSSPTSCIRCGRCIRACSMNLLPTELEHAYDQRDKAALNSLKVNLCMNCGACSYVCPAGRNISEKNQLAKLFLRANS